MQYADSVLATGYRYFLCVAQLGSVRAASRQLNVAASAISRQILLLEGQLGIALFERQGRHLMLTDAGSVLLRSLKHLQIGHEEALTALTAFKDLKRGRVRVATVESISVAILPDLVAEFARMFPGIQVVVTVAGADTVIELVRDHDADIGFTFSTAPLEGLSVEFERSFRLGATMSPDHILAKREKIALADCLAFPVAWPAQGLSLRAIIDQGLAGPSQFIPAFECNSLRLMASLARRGACIAFQTQIGIEREIKEGQLVFKPLTDRRLPLDHLKLVRRQKLTARSPLSAFLDLARRRLQQATEPRGTKLEAVRK
ncbi:MAG TPA: LysR family transcriptional regulator [Terriglobales bacterium]|nr:LysR family transcriptional regulator [Terriglobales bacterium]